MALTEAQKTSIKRHLGYHGVAQSRYPLVEGFSSLEQVFIDLPAATEAEVVTILERIEELEDDAHAARSRFKALKVGSIELPGRGEFDSLRSSINHWRQELSTLLGIPRREVGMRIVV